MQGAENLVGRGIKALVIACNTATSVAIQDLRSAYPELIVIGIEPALKVAADIFPGGNIGVMATQVTLHEEKFAHQLQRFPDAKVSLIPMPGLVELVEAGSANTPAADALLAPVLSPYAGKLDALVLGGTHYPFAAAAIQRIVGEKTLLVDGGAGTARQTKRCLQEAGLVYAGPGSVQIENSSHDKKLIRLCMELLEDRDG